MLLAPGSRDLDPEVTHDATREACGVLLEVPSPEWDERLHIHGLTDAYLRSGYVSASATIDAGEPMLLMHESNGSGVVFPLLIRAIGQDEELHDVTSPYGYGGPVGFGVAPPWEEFHLTYERWCRDRRIVTTFTRFHPLYGNQRHAAPSNQVVPLAGTVGWRIDAGRDLNAQLRQNHRRALRQTERRGLRVTRGEVDDDGLARFRDLYTSTMDRVDAGDYYRFPDVYWRTLRAGLGSTLSLAEVTDDEGRVLAAALLLRSSPWLHYHLGASSDEGRRVGATAVLFVEVAKAAQDEGFDVFHLGGGVGGSEDSLLRFKLGFDAGGLRASAIGKQIHDMDEYRRLTGSTSTSGYFPSYRRHG